MPDSALELTLQPTEREMTTHQKALVNSCLEEGQYEAGITILDQLRSPQYKPSLEHVRALLYIALYPPLSVEIEAGALTVSPTKLESPRKVKQRKLSMEPSATATDAASRLLYAFALTNTPDALLRAVPHFDIDINYTIQPDDSYLNREAICIAESRCCWSMLRGNFIKRKDLTKVHDSRPHGWNSDHETNRRFVDAADSQTVGTHSWSVLELFVLLYEKDEKTPSTNQACVYSPRLLSQIARPTAGKSAKWDAGLAWEVVCYCLEQDLVSRRRIGTRLICLLVHAAHSPDIDAVALMDNLLEHLYGRNSLTFDRFLSSIPQTHQGHVFKVLLAKQYLSNQGSRDAFRTKPKPRAQPRRRGTGAEVSQLSAETDSRPMALLLNDVVRKIRTPDILRLLSQTGPQSTVLQSIKMKYELAMAFHQLQQSDRTDSEWHAAVMNGSVNRAFENAVSNLDTDLDDTVICSFITLKELLRCVLNS